MDGEHLVVLTEDGRASTDARDVPEDVLAAARALHPGDADLRNAELAFQQK